MRIHRHFTAHAADPFAGVGFKHVDVEICSADPAARVCLTDIEVPASWSFAAAETFARYYVRRAGVPARTKRVPEAGVPAWLQRSVPDVDGLPEAQRFTQEASVRQVFGRLAGAWTYWGMKQGYFDHESDARAFHDEVIAMLARQVMAPNSPQWFNTGLHWAYGLTGPAQGHFCAHPETGALMPSPNAYERPQLQACFLHGVKDDLVNEGGIMHLFEREARAFKYGSGAGANLSAVRGAGEELSGGAAALGLMRFLAIGDKAAGAIHSGGLPRRAGKMVVVDIDHPDILSFIRWKGEEQYKAAALIAGARVMRQHLSGVLMAITRAEGEERCDAARNPALAKAIEAARAAMIPASAIERVITYARQGYRELTVPIYTAEDDSDVFMTVGAHQSRQAVRLDDGFLAAAEGDGVHALRRRTDGGTAQQFVASELLDELAHAVWATGEPTLQFRDRIAADHACPAMGPIQASTPGSEYFFVDDTACPLASINAGAFAKAGGDIDLDGFAQAVRISTLLLDVSVGMAQYPSRIMAQRTLDARPIGLGMANVAGLLAAQGVAYASAPGQAMVAGLTALLTGHAALASAELARELGEFPAYSENREACLGWLGMRRVRTGQVHAALADAATRVWEKAVLTATAYGLRNAQLSCVPPTATIARMMDCDTLGLMPLAGVVEFRPQPGGRARKALRANVQRGLQALGYSATEIAAMERYACGARSLADAPGVSQEALKAHGFGAAELALVEEALGDAADLAAAFEPFVLGERFCREVLRLPSAALHDADFSVLAHLGFDAQDVAAAEQHACGRYTLDGAPGLKPEHAAVFAGADAAAQIDVLAAAQPYLSGGIAHTVMLPQATSLAACRALILAAWRKGLKSITLKRDGAALYDEVTLPATGSAADSATVLPLRA